MITAEQAQAIMDDHENHAVLCVWDRAYGEPEHCQPYRLAESVIALTERAEQAEAEAEKRLDALIKVRASLEEAESELAAARERENRIRALPTVRVTSEMLDGVVKKTESMVRLHDIERALDGAEPKEATPIGRETQ